MPNFTMNGYDFYNAPKNGGTTVRMWLKYAEGGLPADFPTNGYYTLAKVSMPRQWTDTVMARDQFFKPGAEASRRWCIIRDPVDRFISAYTDKILHEKLASWNVDTCLGMLQTGEMEQTARAPERSPAKQAACHLLGQHIWFGNDKTYFDRIFCLTDMERVHAFCEEVVFQMKLPSFHGRNQSQSGTDRVTLSSSQRDRLEQVYAEDYRIGWCCQRAKRQFR